MILYQYRGVIDGCKGFEHLVNLLKDGSMKFEMPSKFNDPFDCCPTYLSELPEEAWPHAAGSELNNWAQSAISATHGVSCFTPHPDSMLMWSHYGDQHRSVCVGFDFDTLRANPPKNDAGNALYTSIEKVEYTKDRPDADDPRSLMQKALVWDYEDEYRIISSMKRGNPAWGPGVWNLPVSSIKEVVIGAKVTPPLQKKIVDMAKRTAPGVVIKKAVLHMHTFDLVIENLDALPNVAPMTGAVLDPNGNWRKTP